MLKLAAFTLIELLIVIAIVAVLAAIAYPNFASFIERQKLVSAAERLSSDLKWAKSEAIKRNDTVTIDFTEGANGSWSYNLSDSDGVIKSFTAADGVDYSVVSMTQNFGADDTGFSPVIGNALEKGTVSFVSAAGNDLQVVLSMLGRARICSDAGLSGYETC